ncbi:hypothetical protein [Pseudomonas sp. RGM2987]|uniref:hypothetical protein n=1 Tax=Pseudomonas sp. RGM2987 TaxID=2930090 RepID=UPI001FD640CA|nr:hypothetical protein [Pseudomonas sp. RGM2987]MCJ8207037.1 hypothetical protein [Pseudomonas sp. RGM2987]
MNILAGLVAGLILAILVSTVVDIAVAASPRAGGGAGAIVFFVTWILALAIAVSAPTAGKTWRRLLVTSGIAAFILPLASFFEDQFGSLCLAQTSMTPSTPRMWFFARKLKWL